jgi:hypothetical protein
MDEVDMAASAVCHCGCSSNGGSGGGTRNNPAPCRRYRDDKIDELYEEIRQLKKKFKEKYPDEE